eukprot:scaffold151488_cov33-Tisochrysis_lutea.AAC.5
MSQYLGWGVLSALFGSANHELFFMLNEPLAANIHSCMHLLPKTGAALRDVAVQRAAYAIISV